MKQFNLTLKNLYYKCKPYKNNIRLNTKFKIFTNKGYQKFYGIMKVNEHKGIKFTFNNNTSITCTLNHRFMLYGYPQIADNLFENDYIENLKIIKKEYVYCNYFFDVLNVENGNTFIANGVNNHNCNLIIVDECAYIPSTKWNDFVDGVLPSQSSLAWKKTIFLSTPNGMNHFYDIVQGAKKHKIIEDVNKEDIKNYDNIINIIKKKDDTYNIELNESSNNFKLITVDWREVPRYDSKGRRLDPEEFKRITIEKSGIVFFNQAYACEFIGSSYTLISSDTLKTFESKNPIDYLHVPNSDQVLKIYEEVIEKHKYLIAIDGAKDGNDNFAIQILDITTLPFKQVGAGKLSVDYLLMPSFIDEIGTIYNNAFVIIENNEGAGQSIADMLFESYEYANLYFDKDLKNNYKKYPGFRTTTKTRDQILKTLKLMLENNQLLICDNDTIKEFFTFILKKNKFQADDGFHDDMVMSLAIAMCIFSNTNNFEDMKIIIDNIYSKENENIDITAMLTIGDFYDGSHEADNTNTDLNIYNFGI